LRSGAFFFDVADDVKNFAVKIGFIDTFAEFFVAARILCEINKLVSALFTPIKAMGCIFDLFNAVTDFISKIVAPGFEQLAVPIGLRIAYAGIDSQRFAQIVFGIDEYCLVGVGGASA